MVKTLKPVPIWDGAPPLKLGESPAWLPNPGTGGRSLLAVDIEDGGGTLYTFSLPEGETPSEEAYSEAHVIGDNVASFAPIEGEPWQLLIAKRDGLFVMDYVAPDIFKVRERTRLLVPAPYDPRILRFNDGKASPTGDFWVGTYDQKDSRGFLYRYHAGVLEVVREGIGSSNGLAWSPDGSLMYHADTRRHVVWVATVDGSGMPGEWREFLTFPFPDSGVPYQGRPDGATVDSEGNYWVAMYKGSQVRCYSPLGELLLIVDTSDFTDSPTMVCHGGADLRTLNITGVNCPVLKVRVDVPGLPVNTVVL